MKEFTYKIELKETATNKVTFRLTGLTKAEYDIELTALIDPAVIARLDEIAESGDIAKIHMHTGTVRDTYLLTLEQELDDSRMTKH